MVKRIFILLLVNLFALNGVFLYSFEPLSLDTLIKDARVNNPEILAARKRWEAAIARIPQAKSLDNPTLGVEFEKIPRGTLKFNRVMPKDRMLSIAQMFPLFGKLSLKGKIAVVESQMFAAEYKNKELEVINEVKNAYYNLYMNYKELELSEQSLIFLQGIAKTAEAKYIVGEISQEEVLKIHLEIAKLNNAIENLRKERKAKETRINFLINGEPESEVAKPQLSEDIDFDKDLSSLYKFTLENQPELLIFSYAIEKNKFAKSLAKKSFFPDLMSEITLRGVTSGAVGPWDLMLAFSVPLWFWTKQRYEVKEAIANLEEAEAAYQAMKNKALWETKDLYTKTEIAKNKIRLYNINLIPILESSIESSLADFRSGKGNFMMLLDTQRMFLETKMDYYKVLAEYNMNLADLERTLGIELKEVRQ
jgi:outer membrane protein TolC